MDDYEKFYREVKGYANTTGLELISCGTGEAQVALPLRPEVLNPVGAAHGGALATLVDDAGTVAIMTGDRHGRPGVTTDLNVTYLAPARSGRLIARARARKIGRTMAFADVEVSTDDGTLVALGRITKFLST